MAPTFDIESVEWTTPVAVGFYDDRNYVEFFKTSDDHDVIWEFLSYLKKNYSGLKLYAHNASNYDNKFILDCLTRRGEHVKFLAGLGKIVWVGPNISFEDSYLLLSRSLAICCKAFGVSDKLRWDHEKTRNIWETKNALTAFREYLKRDCLSLSEVLDAFTLQLLDNFGVVPSSTLALTAIKAFDRSFYPLKKISPNLEFESFIREATYGSRNEVYKRYGENLNFYDIKRMFMSCYDTPVPVGKMRWTRPSIDRGTLAEAKVKVPDMLVGPLPLRYEGKLVFPVGEFKGWWDMVELRMASQLGVDITLVRQLEAEEEPVLEPFSTAVNKLSEESNSDLSRIWKLFGLRLSGKFGQNKLSTEIRHIMDIAEGEYNPIDMNEVYHEVVVKSNGVRSPYIKPAINMRIRAEARVRHLAKLLEAKDVYYCDTDSVYTTSIMDVGDSLGQLKLIDTAQRAYFIGSKFYGYVDGFGNLKQRTAGYRDYQLTEDDLVKVLGGEEIPCAFKRIDDWRSVLRGKGVQVIERNFTYRQASSPNRIMDGVYTKPYKLAL